MHDAWLAANGRRPPPRRRDLLPPNWKHLRTTHLILSGIGKQQGVRCQTTGLARPPPVGRRGAQRTHRVRLERNVAAHVSEAAAHLSEPPACARAGAVMRLYVSVHRGRRAGRLAGQMNDVGRSPADCLRSTTTAPRTRASADSHERGAATARRYPSLLASCLACARGRGRWRRGAVQKVPFRPGPPAPCAADPCMLHRLCRHQKGTDRATAVDSCDTNASC